MYCTSSKTVGSDKSDGQLALAAPSASLDHMRRSESCPSLTVLHFRASFLRSRAVSRFPTLSVSAGHSNLKTQPSSAEDDRQGLLRKVPALAQSSQSCLQVRSSVACKIRDACSGRPSKGWLTPADCAVKPSRFCSRTVLGPASRAQTLLRLRCVLKFECNTSTNVWRSFCRPELCRILD